MRPLCRAVVWFIYTVLIAEGAPLLIVYLLSRLDGAPPKVLQSFLGMTTMILSGFGILVAATGDRFIDRGPTTDLGQPLLWIAGLLGVSTYFLYKQYICSVTPENADLCLTCAIGLIAIGAAVQVKYHDWQRTYVFSQAAC